MINKSVIKVDIHNNYVETSSLLMVVSMTDRFENKNMLKNEKMVVLELISVKDYLV